MGFFLLIVAITAVFLLVERLRPGRPLPPVEGWYARAVALNLCQLGLVHLAGIAWGRWFQARSLSHVEGAPIALGFLFWFLGSFVFYVWHRIRHRDGWWRLFHQVHHSPSRIETLTSFYKHPLEMAVNSIIISSIVYGVFGGSPEVAGWYNIFAVSAEYFYHMNVATPHWVGYVLQRPEHHAIHHQTDVHRYNFGDITWWDRIFGTFKDADGWTERCGFDGEREAQLAEMLAFRDVHGDPK